MFSPSTSAKLSSSVSNGSEKKPISTWDIRSLDCFPKTMDDFRVKTVSGSIGNCFY